MSGYTFYYIDQNGIEYQINDNVDVFLKPGGMRGFGMLKATAQTEQIPYRDGSVLVGNLYTGERKMELALQVMLDDWAEVVAKCNAFRRNCSPYKDPSSLGKLKAVRPDGAMRYIDCWLIEWPDPAGGDGPAATDVTPTFWAPNPFFYDPTQVTQTLAITGDSGITFPITFPITFGSTSIDSYIYPNNTGDVETWPMLRLNGPGSEPVIENEITEKKIELDSLTLAAGDYVTIDMENATVTWYDASAGTTTSIIEKLSNDSEFWPLARGENVIHVTMTDAVAGSIILSYYLRYLSL